ncbi:MAG: hypothetical protein NWR72_01005 [Bacteroidia bacterium]|nr:hypothetical protein [Bacteroidia bacterium]
MEWLNDLKEKFSRRRIKSLDRTKEFSRDFVDIESARFIGVIVNVDALTPEDQTLAKEYLAALKQKKKRTLVIEISFNKKSEPTWQSQGDEFIFINPNKLNWLEYPTPAIESQIRQYELDILIDLDVSLHMTSKYVCSMAKARTRTGIHREGLESCYELMIHRPEENDLKSLLKEFDYFLNMIDNGQRAHV